MQGMIARQAISDVGQSLGRFPAVALLGPRQVGKTTLAHTIAASCPSLYLDLESPEDLLKLRDPLAFFRYHQDRLMVIDEMQRLPDLFPVLRGVIDHQRQAGRKTGLFLLLGSASMDLMRQSSESLAGRICFQSLSGINALEYAASDTPSLMRLWLRGGFPESLLAASDAAAMEWLEMLVRTYLERDVPQFGFRVPASRLRRLWSMLAHLQGEVLNYSKLAGNLEVDSKTVSHYLDILVELLLVRRLQPWHVNAGKRLVKSPRYYIRDSGIVHRLLGIRDMEDLNSNPVLGKSWEGFAIENLLSCAPMGAESWFYRSAAGAEIDLVLRLSSTALWAIEVKYGLAPKISPGFHLAAADVGATRKFVVYGGQDEFPIEKDTTMISLPGLMARLRSNA